MVTLGKLAEWLEERELAIQFHPTYEGWSVWLYAPEDAAVRVCAERDELDEAVQAVMAQWDRTAKAPEEAAS